VPFSLIGAFLLVWFLGYNLSVAVQRVRPKMMTLMAILIRLLPMMWSTGIGSDLTRRVAAPMVGGVITSFLLELFIYPAVYTIWKWWAEVRSAARGDAASAVVGTSATAPAGEGAAEP
jgi:Cu(I)/Ag(I) efflux system membrane protein CusA/SilA